MPRSLSEADVAAFRERLIDAAERLFAEHGIEAVTIRQLAADLGVSAMTPYRYFEGKAAILAATRARGFRRFAETLEAAGEARAMGVAYVRFALENPAAYKLMFDVHQPDEEAWPELLEAEVRARKTMTSYIEPGAAGGMDRDLLGHVYWAALHGPIMLHLAGKLGPPNDIETVIGPLMRALEQALPVRVAERS